MDRSFMLAHCEGVAQGFFAIIATRERRSILIGELVVKMLNSLIQRYGAVQL